MAFYDDRHFLLSHIHHSFITCDDSGMCELSMLNEVVSDKNKECHQEPEEKILNYYSDFMDSELLESGQSYDVATGIRFMGGHRHRSNTAQRLERLRKEKQMQAQIAHIQWREYPDHLSEKELSELFPKKDLTLTREKKPVVKSALSEALELSPVVANNPFNEYAHFDGRININVASKKILIYLTMLPTEERNYGMEVECLSSARVHELIGLICWMYTCEGKQPKLQPPVSNYCLKIAEETGEVDEDFPYLDANEFVGKFGFPYLALIERANRNSISLVTVHIMDETAKVEVPNLDVTLREVADLASQKISVTESKAYHMEKPSEPGVPIPLDYRLVNFNYLDFNLVFEEDSRDSQPTEYQKEEYDYHMRAVEAPLYRSYNVCQIQKMGMNYEVQLGISGEKVEIHPLPPKGAAKLLTRPQKPTIHYMNTVAACEIISKKYSPGKCIFKLVHYTGSEFKKYTFEADPHTAQEVVKKIQVILEMHSTDASKEYQSYRERKLLKKVQKSH